MLSDLRFAFRQLAKSPGFTTTIVVTLALAIGACTAIYSALDSIVLHPFDDPATQRNVLLSSLKMPQRIEGGVSSPDFVDLEKQATSFEFMARHIGGEVNINGTSEPLRLRSILATEHYLKILGTTTALGRPFLAEEFIAGKNNVVILSHGSWQRDFGGAPDIIGRTLLVDEIPCTVVGVVAEQFERMGYFLDVLLPLLAERPAELGRSPRSARSIGTTIARLRAGVTMEQAQAELDLIASSLSEKYPETNRGYRIQADMRDRGRQILVPIIQVLFCAVGCVILIACANIASLLLVRANSRQREMSVRAAMGASRGRLIRQLLTESLLAALLGGAIGVLLAQWTLDFIRASIPGGSMNLMATGMARLAHLKLDGGILAFSLGLSLVTALFFGLAPAWLSSSVDVNEALKQGTRGSTEGRSRSRFRTVLIVVEIAIAVTLLACSGLLIRSFIKLTAHHPGFNPAQTGLARVSLRGPRYAKSEEQIAFTKNFLARLQTAPGVEAVGVTSYFPLTGPYGGVAGFEIEGSPAPSEAERPPAFFIRVSPDYFHAMAIPLQQGRFFSERDDASSGRVAIINETLARQFFPNQSPVGKRITIANGSNAWREIVGVVGDVGQAYIGEVQPAQFYEPHAQSPTPFLRVVARGPGDPAKLPALIKTHIQALDPSLPVGEMRTVDDFLHAKLTPQRLTLHLLTTFAAIGLFIAAIGIYGVIAFSVSQRTPEIGIRMALGAQRQDVLRMILSHGARLVGVGMIAGIIATFAAGAAIETQLYNTSGRDPVALIGITLFFAVVAAFACWLPARRATKVDPMVALRTE